MDEDFFDLDGIDAPPPPPPPLEQQGEPPYLTTLNAVQKQAVLATEGPVLVLAGAGTGKTRVLTTRLGHLMATNLAQPWNILSVTFTNKAALEMKERVGRIMQRPVDDMWIGTFHSIANRILRKHGELVGLKSNFTILDTDDQIRLLKQLIQGEGIDDKKFPARLLASLIDRWKNKAITPDRLPKEETFAYADGKGGKLKQLVADLSLDKQMLQDVLKKSSNSHSKTISCWKSNRRLQDIEQKGMLHNHVKHISILL